MNDLTFPTNPTLGQLFVGTNSVTYQWLGNFWSTANPAINGFAYSIVDGGFSDTMYNQLLDFDLDGGGA